MTCKLDSLHVTPRNVGFDRSSFLIVLQTALFLMVCSLGFSGAITLLSAMKSFHWTSAFLMMLAVIFFAAFLVVAREIWMNWYLLRHGQATIGTLVENIKFNPGGRSVRAEYTVAERTYRVRTFNFLSACLPETSEVVLLVHPKVPTRAQVLAKGVFKIIQT